MDDDSWDVKSYRMIFRFDDVRDFWRMRNVMYGQATPLVSFSLSQIDADMTLSHHAG